jgi:hypothetical protein
MFTQSVNDQQHSFYVLFVKPTLIVYIDVSHSLEVALDVFHMDLLSHHQTSASPEFRYVLALALYSLHCKRQRCFAYQPVEGHLKRRLATVNGMSRTDAQLIEWLRGAPC